MKITRVTTAVIEANFDWTIVKIETDNGLVGYGEAAMAPAVTAVIAEFRSLLIGEELASIDRLLRRLKSACAYVSPGLTFHAIGGIEIALLDLIGQELRVPIWRLLGGKYRDQVPIYADCHGGDALESIGPLLIPRTPHWTGLPPRESRSSVKHHGADATSKETFSPETYAARAQEMAARGFGIVKFDVDVPPPVETDEYNRDLSRTEIDYAASLVAAVREAVGPGVGLAIDCHWNYNIASAVALARALEPYHLLWLEDPVPPENLRAMGEVQRATATTIATGENQYHRVDFERLILESGLRLLAPDVQKVGIWEGRKLADLADMHFVNLTLHNVAGPIGTMAGVHLGAAIPNLLALEWHAASVPFFDELARGVEGPMIREGRIAVPEGPGLGIALNEEVAQRYRKPGEAFFE